MQSNVSFYELFDVFEPTLLPLFRLKPAFDFSAGIHSPLETAIMQWKNNSPDTSPVFHIFTNQSESVRPVSFYQKYLLFQMGTPVEISVERTNHPGDALLTPASLLNLFPESMLSDLKNDQTSSRFNAKIDPGCSVTGERSLLMAAHGAEISSMAAIDTTEGPVIIDKDVKISPFCHLKGPLYLSRNVIADHVNISNSRIGMGCRIGGEIADSIMGEYSNKHHEGFLGHSLVGDWVNLGALTTTSDLKNNYGLIRLRYRGRPYETGLIKFGSIIADHVKTGIGTLLNTGTIIDTGALIFQGAHPAHYFPPFFWGGGPPVRYHLTEFLADAEKIMARRSRKPAPYFQEFIEAIYREQQHDQQSLES